MSVTAGVAAIKGTYAGEVSLADLVAPHSLTMKASGAGAPGTIDADVKVRLAPAAGGGTELTYDADASVGGAIGGVGQRMLAGVDQEDGRPVLPGPRPSTSPGVPGRRPAPPQRAVRRSRQVTARHPPPCMPVGAPPRTPRPRSTSTAVPASPSGRSSVGSLPWRASPWAPGSRGGPDARVHRSRRPGRPGPRAADGGVGRGQPRQARRDHAPVRRGDRRRARRAARVGDDRLHPRHPDRGALGAGVRAAGPRRRPAASTSRPSSASTSSSAPTSADRPPTSSTTPPCSSTRRVRCSASTARRIRSTRRVSVAVGGSRPATRSRCATPSSAGSA